MINTNKIKNTGSGSQSAINTGSGHIVQITNNFSYGVSSNTDDPKQPKPQDPENKERIRLSDLVGPGMPLIEGKEFFGADILGPCVIYPLSGVNIQNCDWIGITESLFIEIPEEWKGVSGVVGLRHCKFENCSFKNVAIMAKSSDMPGIKAGFKLKP